VRSAITATAEVLVEFVLEQNSTQRLIGLRRYDVEQYSTYRVVQKSDTPDFFCHNFRKCTPILTIFSPLEQEIYDA